MNRYICVSGCVVIGLLSALSAAPALAQGKTAAPLDPLNPLSRWEFLNHRGPVLRPAPPRPAPARDRRPEYQQKVTDRVLGAVTEPISDGTLNRLSEWKPQMGAKLRTVKNVSDWSSDPLAGVLGKVVNGSWKVAKVNAATAVIEGMWPEEFSMQQGSTVPQRLYRDANRLDEELEGGEWAHTGFQQVLRMGRRPRHELEAQRETLRREITRRKDEERQEWAREEESLWLLDEVIRRADEVLASPDVPAAHKQFISREADGVRNEARRLREWVQPRRPQQVPDLQFALPQPRQPQQPLPNLHMAPQPTQRQPVQQQPPSEIKFVPRTPTPVLGAPGAGKGSGRGAGCKGTACRAD